jgi:mono/diheme cytochrome c family protein
VRPLAVALACGLAAGGCDLSMTRQARHDTARGAAVWPGGPQAQPSPAGAVPVDAPLDPDPTRARPTLDAALLARGRERYEIYCTPCHGAFGEGDGRIVQRGFPRPPSYDEPRLRAAPAEHFVAVISDGYGVMYAYGDRISVADRWAIAAYIRALQLAHGLPAADAGGAS